MMRAMRDVKCDGFADNAAVAGQNILFVSAGLGAVSKNCFDDC